MTTRRCCRCGVEKPLAGFSPNKSKPGGVRYACKDCVAKEAKERRDANLERARKRERECDRKQYWENPEKYKPLRRKYPDKRADPVKEAARLAMRNAVKRGDLIRPTACQDCGATGVQIQGHHEDYSKPLDVAWVCTRCHGRRHRINEENAA